MTAIFPVTPPGFVRAQAVPAALTGSPVDGFIRYRGDDWDGVNLLLFQYGTVVPGAITANPDGTTSQAPPTVTPIDITGYQPVGSIILRASPSDFGLRNYRETVAGKTYAGSYSRETLFPTPSVQGFSMFTLSVAAGTARIVDAPNGFFAFCPRSDITSQLPAMRDDATLCDARVLIAAKLIDTSTPGNLGTIAKTPVLVLQA